MVESNKMIATLEAEVQAAKQNTKIHQEKLADLQRIEDEGQKTLEASRAAKEHSDFELAEAKPQQEGQTTSHSFKSTYAQYRQNSA